jgi:16S rRNA (uracil1498-N3)-methyltransferase
MAIHDFNSQRLFIDAPLAAGAEVTCDKSQSNYLVNVLRLEAGADILLFNGADGEWRAVLTEASKRAAVLTPQQQTRAQTAVSDLHYVFAPLKHSRLDYMVQKSAELGVGVLRPVITRRTIAERVNLERMRSNAIEAAEQCGILTVPRVAEPERFERAIDAWDRTRTLIFCDEAAVQANPLDVLSKVKRGPLGVLVGPEGGFDETERGLLLSKPFVVPVSLGPRIMRADTAAVSILALVNAALGDWAP